MAHAQESADSYLAAIIRASSDAIVGLAPDGCVQSWNPTAEQLFGYTAEEASGQPLARLTHLAPHAEQEVLSAHAREGQVARLETVCVAKNGRRMDVALASTAIMDADGQYVGIAVIFTDITARKQTEAALVQQSAALRTSEAHFLTVANLMPELLWRSDPQGGTEWYSQRWHEYTGQLTQETKGYGWLNAIHPDDRAASLASFQQAMDTRQPLRMENRIRSIDGSYRWFMIQARPLLDEQGNVIQWFSIATDTQDIHTSLDMLRHMRDELEDRVKERTAALEQANAAIQSEVTERRRAEAQTRALLRQLVTAQEDERRRLAFELHEQLGQMVSALHFGLAGLRDAPQWPPSLNDHVEQLQQLVVQFSNDIDRLALEMRPSTLDHFGLAVALQQHVKQWSVQSNIIAEFEEVYTSHATIPPHIATALYRVVEEALNNVRKHAHAQHVGVILGQHATYMFMIVEDDGIGFDMEALQQAPELQHRLGLLGMQERAALVGGTLTIESEPQRGTTVFIRVPLPATSEKMNSAL